MNHYYSTNLWKSLEIQLPVLKILGTAVYTPISAVEGSPEIK